MESGIGSGLSLDQTAPVEQTPPGQNQFSPRPSEREQHKRRHEGEESPADPAAGNAAGTDAAEGANQGDGGEGEVPRHRVDSLA